MMPWQVERYDPSWRHRRARLRSALLAVCACMMLAPLIAWLAVALMP